MYKSKQDVCVREAEKPAALKRRVENMVQAAAMLCSEISLLTSALSLAKGFDSAQPFYFNGNGNSMVPFSTFVQTTELFEEGD
jgi:hypothetical protein